MYELSYFMPLCMALWQEKRHKQASDPILPGDHLGEQDYPTEQCFTCSTSSV
jgi:hypothetical protein